MALSLKDTGTAGFNYTTARCEARELALQEANILWSIGLLQTGKRRLINIRLEVSHLDELSKGDIVSATFAEMATWLERAWKPDNCLHSLRCLATRLE